MASQTQDAGMDQQDDFEIIEAPVEHTESKHVATACSNPFCQKSHVSFEEERASERAIEPLITVMQATAKGLETEGDPIFHAKFINSENPADRNVVFERFLGGLPVRNRRIMNCSACKHFLRKYGDLCVVADDGTLVPLMWPIKMTRVPEYYKEAVENVLKLFEGQEVGNEFKIGKGKGPNGRTLGTPQTGQWNHMSITLEKVSIQRLHGSMNSQDTETSYNMLDHIIQDHSLETVARVHHMLCTDQLPYATSHKAPIGFLQRVMKKLDNSLNVPANRKNLITKYARTAFPGCLSALRSGMVGFLLESVTRGDTFEETKKAWMSKADPLSYMRPTAAPSVGNIESAEKVFARLGYTPDDLRRAFLTLDQVPESAILWSQNATTEMDDSSTTTTTLVETKEKPQRLFNSLLPFKNKTKSIPINFSDAPIKDISFRKFVSSVLPTAAILQMLPTASIQPYFFTTGVAGSKPIMAFHTEGSHTASWYTWGSVAAPKSANLKQEWTPVKAIVSFPHMWDEFTSAAEALDESKAEAFKFKRHGIRFLFVLDEVKDTAKHRSLCLFPTLMRGEFHSVRKTVEAFSNKGNLEEPEQGKDHVGRLAVEKDRIKDGSVVSVKTKDGQVSRYHITLFE